MQSSFFDIADFAPTFTVTQLTRRIKEVVEDDDILGDVRVRGEVSNFVQANSGHVYFTLKDVNAAIRCVMWRNDAARVQRMPSGGDAVEVHGAISMYEARGDVQLYVDEIKLTGAGALWQEFEKLRARLLAEGLFAPEHKRALPAYPRVIGVVTSREGAVLRDICNILRRRHPLAQVLLGSTQVQGAGAAQMIAETITRLNRSEIDLLIVARGGGSLEDLWAFNEECVARAIYNSRVPVISAVGHETDFTIADFVADLRAPTPSAAAELAVIDMHELRTRVETAEQCLAQLTHDRIGDARVRMANALYVLQRQSPAGRMANQRQRLDEMARRLDARTRQLIMLKREVANGAARHLAALNPEATLARGYAIVREKETGQVVRSAAQAAGPLKILIRVRDGEFEATTEKQR